MRIRLQWSSSEVAVPETIFWDVDTQFDFIMPEGRLYIPGAERIIPNLEALTRHARAQGIPILGSVDDRTADDAEISPEPDSRATYPPHCLRGTPGQEKIAATAPLNPLGIESRRYDPEELRRQVSRHRGEIIFRKRKFDIFSNPNLETVLASLAPSRIVVYGVALDVCNAHAIESFLSRKTAEVVLVRDASHAIGPQEGEKLADGWRKRCVDVRTTAEILAGAAKPQG
jgi:nicotinamidase/pyrazinamidase